jgi:hypothetical protein
MHRTVTNSFARGEELNQQLYAGYDTREDPDVEILPSLQVLARAAPGATRRRLRAGPVQAGGRRCLPAGILRPDVHGAAQRVDPETALVGRSAPEAAAPEHPDVEILSIGVQI